MMYVKYAKALDAFNTAIATAPSYVRIKGLYDNAKKFENRTDPKNFSFLFTPAADNEFTVEELNTANAFITHINSTVGDTLSFTPTEKGLLFSCKDFDLARNTVVTPSKAANEKQLFDHVGFPPKNWNH